MPPLGGTPVVQERTTHAPHAPARLDRKRYRDVGVRSESYGIQDEKVIGPNPVTSTLHRTRPLARDWRGSFVSGGSGSACSCFDRTDGMFVCQLSILVPWPTLSFEHCLWYAAGAFQLVADLCIQRGLVVLGR